MKLQYWDHHYTNQRMRNDMRRLKLMRSFYCISRNSLDKWALAIPVCSVEPYDNGDITPIGLGGFMSHELWRCSGDKEQYIFHGDRDFRLSMIGAELVRHEPSLAGLIKIAREARQFWAPLPIKVLVRRPGTADFDHLEVPKNDIDLVAFIMTHS